MYCNFHQSNKCITTKSVVCRSTICPGSNDPFFIVTYYPRPVCLGYVVVVYHVTIVTIGHGLLNKFWPLVISWRVLI